MIVKLAGSVAAVAAIGAAVAGCSDAKDAASSATSAAGSAAGSAAAGASGAASSAGAAIPGAGGESGSAGAAGESGAAGSVLDSPTTTAAAEPAVPSTSIASPEGKDVSITDPAIIAVYASRGYEKGFLGKPLGPVVTLPSGGKFITFEGGSIYENPKDKKAYTVQGAIGGYWGTQNHENGKLGYPTSDEKKTDEGLVQTFDGGTLVDKDGTVTEK
ncbi:LGFP repeat-containing protein [Williamsia sterculiae]|uniref:LGFP repeat-containing protein n=2 Tax=Williamsia sterculiae TaxID=1344003 RepID=A0A1N7H9H7_9NOCA|nr:LGFP repeat-containing protein [Williamsia sterculiae]